MQINLKFLPAIVCISSNELFYSYSKNFNKSDLKKIKDLIYIEHRNLYSNQPDYIHRGNLKNLDEIKTIQNLILHSFEKLDDIFYWRGNELYIKDEDYQDWQNILTLVPSLSILSYKLYKSSYQIKNVNDVINQIFESSTLPSIYNPYLEDLFKNEKLSEVHMHLTGTSETDYVWEDALKNPENFYSEFSKSFNNNQVKELFLQLNTELIPESIFRLITKAKYVRYYLAQILLYDSSERNIEIKENKGINWNSFLNINEISLNKFYKKITPEYSHPYENIYRFSSPLCYEVRFFYDCFNYLENNDDKEFSKLIHFYILAKSIFHKTIVQQLDQYGFDQFEKITVNEIREYSEKKYKNRFKQLKGLYGQNYEYIEGRFSPKNDKEKLYSLVDTIIDDFEELYNINQKRERIFSKLTFTEDYIQILEKRKYEKTPELVLTGHFIKIPDNRKYETIYTYRDYVLRQDLDCKAKYFVDMLKSHPKYTYYIRGIDAAGNELYARPEAFAPAFRYITKRINLLPTDYYLTEKSYLLSSFNKENIKTYLSKTPHIGITYHAGEDFIHLISGIRMVYEAVEFLDMPAKSRIGHATALGIQPELWINKIGNNLKIFQGEWIDNIIFILFFLDSKDEFHSLKLRLKDDLEYYWKEIYGQEENVPTLNILKQTYFCRKLDPQTLTNKRNKIYKVDEEEWNYKKILGFAPSDRVLDLFKKYHNPKYIKNYNKITTVEISTEWIGLIKSLQKEMILVLNDRNIAIETMPTSNIRISFYENYVEHHIFNWHSPKDSDDTIKPILVVGSDDPGIFSNHLRAEFSHLYQTAIKKGATQQQAIKWLKELNANGKIFRF